MTNKDEIAELRIEVERLKAQVAPKPFDPAEGARWQNEMHQLAERRMARASNFSPDQMAAFAAAVPDNVARDIVARGGVRPPSGHGASGTVSSVHGPSGVYQNTSGWAREVPLGPPPGVAQADRLMDAQDARDRHDLIMQEAQRKAAQKLAEGSK